MPATELPPPTAYTPAERRLIARLTTPRAVQGWLNRARYNDEPHGPQLKSFRRVARERTVHCLEAALFAAAVLEHHGYPPLLLSFESIDELDHVLFVYQARGRWGSIARSRDPGLHGRKPVFRSLRALALSYVEPFVDKTGEITGYEVYDLRALRGCDWRFSARNVWKLEQTLLDLPHRRIRSSPARIARLRRKYLAFLDANPGKKPVDYPGRAHWSDLP